MTRAHIFLISIVFSLGCSTDNPEPETDISIFLETNKGVLYEKYNPTDVLRMPYCRFTNNLMAPIEEWYDLVLWGEGCYRHSNMDYSCCYDSHEITKDSATEFQFVLINNHMSGDGILTESKRIKTFKISGDILEIKEENYDDNIIKSNWSSTYNKSSRNIDNLKMCN